MVDPVIHISEAEAARNFADLLARVRAGAEVVIESDQLPVAVLRPADPHLRLLSESLRLAREHAAELGWEPTLDPDFAADLEEIIERRKPRAISPWE